MGQSFLSKIILGGIGAFRRLYENSYREFGISWVALKKLKHQDYNTPGEIILNKKRVKYLHPPELLHSVKEIFIDEVYKISYPIKEPFIIDCGANVGLSVINLKMQFPDAKIIAFEPDSKNFSLLKENTQYYNDIQLENKAVWYTDDVLNFNMAGTQSSSHSANESDSMLKKVKAVRLKDILNRPVFFLKMDIEGAEYKIIIDCKDHLSIVNFLFIEYHGKFEEQNQLVEILQILSGNGFKYYLKEATNVYSTPFSIKKRMPFDVQLNIFAFH